MINRLRETWNTGKPALNGWLAIPSTFSAEIMSHQNFDSLPSIYNTASPTIL